MIETERLILRKPRVEDAPALLALYTVRKHVEHILRRLETPARTAAAALYLTGGGPAPLWTASIASMLA